jgi:HSP20 family protein
VNNAKFNSLAEVEYLPALRHFQETLSRAFQEPAARPWTPAVDIFETENEVTLKMDVPEVELADIQIRLENEVLTVSGDRKWVGQASDKGYHRIERSYGAFARTFTLPKTVNAEQVRAELKNGVLIITLPKKELAKPRIIKVDATAN